MENQQEAGCKDKLVVGAFILAICMLVCATPVLTEGKGHIWTGSALLFGGLAAGICGEVRRRRLDSEN